MYSYRRSKICCYGRDTAGLDGTCFTEEQLQWHPSRLQEMLRQRVQYGSARPLNLLLRRPTAGTGITACEQWCLQMDRAERGRLRLEEQEESGPSNVCLYLTEKCVF